MPISIEELYKHMFEEHRFASEYRLKILASWGVVYAAFAAAFAWVHREALPLSWVVTLLAGVFTVIFWVGDRRHRAAVGGSKTIGKNIESDSSSGIPGDRRYFSTLLEEDITHSTVIDWFAVAMLVLLVLATGYLICRHGALP
jgi:hypothetical protein